MGTLALVERIGLEVVVIGVGLGLAALMVCCGLAVLRNSKAGLLKATADAARVSFGRR